MKGGRKDASEETDREKNLRKHGIVCHSRWQYEKRLSGGGGGIEEVHESHGSEVEHVREKSCMSYQQVKVKGKSEQRHNSKQVNRKKTTEKRRKLSI